MCRISDFTFYFVTHLKKIKWEEAIKNPKREKYSQALLENQDLPIQRRKRLLRKKPDEVEEIPVGLFIFFAPGRYFRNYSRCQPFNFPVAISLGIQYAVVQAVSSSLPEFNCNRPHKVTTPMSGSLQRLPLEP